MFEARTDANAVVTPTETLLAVAKGGVVAVICVGLTTVNETEVPPM